MGQFLDPETDIMGKNFCYILTFSKNLSIYLANIFVTKF
jgi:hypothetical protein